jgi:hypothetical protein
MTRTQTSFNFGETEAMARIAAEQECSMAMSRMIVASMGDGRVTSFCRATKCLKR